MKNSIIISLILLLLVGCSEIPSQEDKTTETIELDSTLLIGCWRLDSSSNCNYSWDELYITDEFDYYLFSRSNGGGLRNYGQIPFKDSMRNQYGTMNSIELLDSFKLKKAWTGWVEHEEFYKKWDNQDVNEELILAFKKDSLRSIVIGWWKLKKSIHGIDLPNDQHGYCQKVTMQIKDDGKVVFYKENQLDSAVSYSYDMYENGLYLNRGCISSRCYSHINKNGDLRFELDSRYQDTLLFERITEIN